MSTIIFSYHVDRSIFIPLSSIENFNSILNGNRDNKETDGPTNNTNNTLLDFECYYCEFKTEMKSNYERHVQRDNAILVRWNSLD